MPALASTTQALGQRRFPSKKLGWTAPSRDVGPEVEASQRPARVVDEVEMLDDGKEAMTSYKLEALAALHERKVAALMRSIGALRDEVARVRAESKEHRRSQYIQSLKDKLREQELAVDVLKEALCERMSEEQVNELVIVRTLGGPKRFRPKSREELQNELAACKRKAEGLARKMGQQQQQQQHEACRELAQAASDTRLIQKKPKEATPRALEEAPSAEHLREVASLAAEAEKAKVSAARYELQAKEAERALQKVRDEKLALEQHLDRAERVSEQRTELERLLASCRADRDEARAESARKSGELEALRMELTTAQQKAAIERQVLTQDLGALQQELAAARDEERDLRAAAKIERERAARAVKGEQAAKLTADGRVAAAERAYRDAVRQRERLEAACDEREKRDRLSDEDRDRRDRRRANLLANAHHREQTELSRLVRSERQAAEKAKLEHRAAVDVATALRGRVDELTAESRLFSEARKDEKARHDADRTALEARIASLEHALVESRRVRDVDAVETDVRIDRVAHRAARDRALGARLLERADLDRKIVARAEAHEAESVAEAAVALQRRDELRALNVALETKNAQLETDLASERASVARADASREALAERLRVSEARRDADDSKYAATRQALIAHVRLADVYARVHDAACRGLSLSRQQAAASRKALAKAQRELERALAASPGLKDFYQGILQHLNAKNHLVGAYAPLVEEAPVVPAGRSGPRRSDQRPDRVSSTDGLGTGAVGVSPLDDQAKAPPPQKPVIVASNDDDVDHKYAPAASKLSEGPPPSKTSPHQLPEPLQIRDRYAKPAPVESATLDDDQFSKDADGVHFGETSFAEPSSRRRRSAPAVDSPPTDVDERATPSVASTHTPLRSPSIGADSASDQHLGGYQLDNASIGTLSRRSSHTPRSLTHQASLGAASVQSDMYSRPGAQRQSSIGASSFASAEGGGASSSSRGPRPRPSA